MIKNENGSALVIVLLMFVILTVLAIAVLGNTLNDAKQTAFREQDIITIHEAQKAVEEAVALIKATFNYNSTESVTLSEHNGRIDDLLGRFNPENFTLNNTENTPTNFIILLGDSFTTSDFSRDFIIVTRAKDINGRMVEFTQRVYLSAIPSFLYYAVGSGSNLYFNGSSTIYGNTYIRDSVFLKKEANYIFDDPQPKYISTTYPFLKGEVVIDNNEKKVYLANDTVPRFLNNDTLNFFVSESGSDVKIGEVDFFNDVDIDKTFVDKFNEISFTKISNSSEINDAPINGSFFQVDLNEFGELLDSNDLLINEDCVGTCSPVVDGNLLLKSSINIPRNHWLLVRGDLWLYPENNSDGLDIDGNILVTGNLIIQGNNMKFDSSILSLEETYINNASIQKLHPDAALILFSKEKLDVSRVSEFESLAINNEINAFLYTASDAILYGVGSKIKINGGIFAEGQLTINAVRGEVEKLTNTLVYPTTQPNQDFLDKSFSRFLVTHTPEILTPSYSVNSKSYNGLPRTSNFNVILDRREFNRN